VERAPKVSFLREEKKCQKNFRMREKSQRHFFYKRFFIERIYALEVYFLMKSEFLKKESS